MVEVRKIYEKFLEFYEVGVKTPKHYVLVLIVN